MSNTSINSDNNTQRALVMQGGSSLGAYEAGVFKALHETLTKQDKERGSSRPLFDILAGTSIGAINAAILVNYFVKHKTWEDSWKILCSFWDDISTTSTVEMDPTFTYRWDDYGYLLGPDVVASPEAARRYYSVKEFFSSGARNVFSPPKVIHENRFLDPLSTSYLYSNKPLKTLLEEKYLTEFPLKTTKGEPRLLVVTVDVQEGATVTFDSYGKLKKNDDGSIVKDKHGKPVYELKAEYGGYNNETKKYEHVIEYPKGITIDHVLASASVPITYDYQDIQGHKFWDGIILSNTPLRELIGEHKTFWEAEIPEATLVKGIWTHQDIQKVPDLEAYIVNLWPTKEKRLPYDYDGQVDRKNDILYHDKTKYDQKVAVLVTDYIDLAKKIRELATKHIKDQNEKSAFQKELDDYLKVTDAKSEFRTGIRRKYIDLLKGRFNISKVERIERQDDIHTISNKWADFSSGTINNMINCGYQEALTQLKVRHQ